MRITICWPLISGYMAACWRALAAQSGVSLQVLAWRPEASRDHIDFDLSLVEGLDVRLLDGVERCDARLIRGEVEAYGPDVVVVPGWFWRPYREIVDWAYRRQIRVIMTMDTSLQLTMRQLLGRWIMAGYFGRIAGVYVPGERAFQLARVLGFRESQIRVGSYGFDYPLFAGCLEQRAASPMGWPRSFLYVGRYVVRKGIDTLVEAYERYRRQVANPWALITCGQGPLEERLQSIQGVTNRGFVQPQELPSVMSDAGAFVLPSRFEAWGVALAEAGAAGLPLIASRSVGATAEVLRDFYNGRRFDTGDASSLAAAMHWVHEQAPRAAELGDRSRCLAEPFRSELWAERLLTLTQELSQRGR
ncbi:glycosyl transferase, group 1 [sediment metagenome]|uniref:Glycosyl transferase, group 1 n=1 Tax=sediment metagenome TaxID=749907 RepID=D9PIQ6_9ZZZZ